MRVLTKNGIEVVVPAAQGCCGALHAHAGYRDTARELARRNLDALLVPGTDAIISNAAGCGAMLKEYGELLAGDPACAAQAREFSARSRDVTEYLAAIGLRSPVRARPLRVTYQDPCHLAHAQGVRSAPRELLRQVGAQVVEMQHPDYCCGSAGTYNIVENDLSMKILDAKMDDLASTSADVIATANVGCMLQLQAGLRRRALSSPVRHVIELLDESY